MDTFGVYKEPQRTHEGLKQHFRVLNVKPLHRQWNQVMNTTRVLANSINFHKNLKIQLSDAGKVYIVCVFLKNARSFIVETS